MSAFSQLLSTTAKPLGARAGVRVARGVGDEVAEARALGEALPVTEGDGETDPDGGCDACGLLVQNVKATKKATAMLNDRSAPAR